MIELGETEYGRPAEVARALGVPRQCVYDWLRSGRLTPVRDGRAVYVRLDEATAAELATRRIGRRRAGT